MSQGMRSLLGILLACTPCLLAGCGGSGTTVTSMAPNETQVTEGGYHFVFPAGPDGKPDGWTLSSQGNTVSAKKSGGPNLEIKGNQLTIDGKAASKVEVGDSIQVGKDGKIIHNGRPLG